MQASIDSIETLNDQLKEEERQKRELIQQILQCKNDIENTNCKLSTLKNELRKKYATTGERKDSVDQEDSSDFPGPGRCSSYIWQELLLVGWEHWQDSRLEVLLSHLEVMAKCTTMIKEVRAKVRTKSLGPTVLKALCPYLRSNCFLMSSLVQKFK